jgi:hypothetical protein
MLAAMPRPVTLAVAAALCALTTACGGGGQPAPYDATGVDELEIPTPSPDPADFVDTVDNPLLPLTPGSTWRYEVREGVDVVETIEVTVLEETRTVAGVTATVVSDVVTDAGGEVVEETFDWFAQDRDGNVWYLGEDTTSYEDGAASTEGSWEAGVDGAMAGLVMPAEPRVGDGFEQEHLEGVAEDRARVLDVAASWRTPFGAWDDLLETEDTTPLEPDVLERKLYARGIGLVAERDLTEDQVTQLVDFTAG